MALLSQCAAGYAALAAQNRWLILAAVNTVVFLAGFVGFGLLIRLAADGLTALLGLIFGRKAAFAVRNVLTYPGVVHHELAHALFARITGARIDRITLRPVGDTLGSVQFTPRGTALRQALQLTLSAIAPVVCGTLTLALLMPRLLPWCQTLWQRALWGYWAVSVFFHMDLSPQDVRVALRGLPICALLIFLLTLALLFFGINDLTLILSALPSAFRPGF